MFMADEITVPAGFAAAASRLLHVINKGVLRNASTAAYEAGLTAILRVGPFGEMRGASKLIRVQFLAPVRRGATMTVPLRWESAGPAGDLFPVLDADLILARHGDDRVHLGLSASYRPPFGRAGAALDRALMKHVAAATIRSLLENLALAIADPAPEPLPEFRPALTWPLTRPEVALSPRVRVRPQRQNAMPATRVRPTSVRTVPGGNDLGRRASQPERSKTRAVTALFSPRPVRELSGFGCGRNVTGCRGEDAGRLGGRSREMGGVRPHAWA